MTGHDFDDETLMAFADGELDAATSAELEEALATDEALAERLAVFLDSRRLVADTLKPLVDEPLPDALLASVRRMADEAQNNVVAFRPKQRQETPPLQRLWRMPLAASIVAAVAGVAGFTVGRNVEPSAASGTEIAMVLDREASGRDVALGASRDALHVIATFRDERGTLCREYELKQAAASTLSIACRQDGAWVTRLALTSSKANGYVPASSQETVDAYLASIQAGTPLSAAEEREALTQ